MPFVLDASITITWAMRDENHPVADTAFRLLDSQEALVPAIWWYEVRNILVINERRQRITQVDSAQFLRDVEHFPIRMDGILNHFSLPDIARQFKITVYDAAYLDLALRERIPLATLDKALRTAAESAGVPLLA